MSRLSLRFLVVALSLALPLAAFAANVAPMSAAGTQLSWSPAASSYESVDLVVSAPDGQIYTKRFTAQQTPSFSLADLGSGLADGVYLYELRVNPRIAAQVAVRLKAAREAGDDIAAKKILAEAGVAGMVQSGSFSILGGSLVPLDASESSSRGNRHITTNARPTTPVTNDQVIPDDLIVQGSACVGIDCVNNENFGFDTIRMKENNTRIHFEDTSTTAGFPSNDWEITANDSASGGSNKFSIMDRTSSKVPFTLTAGASTNSIFVDSTGRVGFRTSTPVLDLHVATSNTPALRLEQNSSGGFSAQTWDIAGNEANFFVRDVTGGSKLSLRIRPGAPTSSVDIAADGDVGIGTGSPESKLHVFGASNVDTFIAAGNDPDGSAGNESALNIGYSGASFGRASGFINVRPDSGAVAPNPSFRMATANVVRMLIDNEGFIGLGDTASSGGNPTTPIQYTNGAVTARLTTAGVWQDNSSRAAKENIHELSIEEAFSALKALEPVQYNYKVLPNDPKVGFIAEDVPDLVATPERDGLSALDIVAVVTRVVKEQQKTIDLLNQRIAQLEKATQQ